MISDRIETEVPASTLLHPAAIPLIGPGKYLDVGCGSGRISRKIAYSSRFVVGIDINFQALDLANQSTGVDHLAYVQALGQNLPFRSESFEGGFSVGDFGDGK